jgi:proton-dependent oligopeptide transporter, POT family
MAAHAWRTAPDPNEKGWPKGVPYIIGNEGCERFSFYGMKSILQVHLTALYAATSLTSDLSESHAQEMVHLFIAGVYAFPMIGAILADRLLGKYQTILWLSLVYCAGHAALAIGEDSLMGMAIGLGLIAIGSGGIKPCVSANVGDQFGKGNWNLVTKVFQAFYFIINFGSFFATLAIPWIKVHYGTSVAFGLPGVLMFIATVVFWIGRDKFVHVPPRPSGKLGAMDALSSSLLFLGLIGLPLFFTDILPLWAFIAGVVGLTGVGLAVFAARQRIEADHGFLAPMIEAIRDWSSGHAAKVAAKAPADAHEIRRSRFFAGVAERHGDEVADGPAAVLRIVSVFFLVSVFWALFDQHSSSWIRQAQRMDLHVLAFGTSFDLLPSQIPSLNPLMVMALIPLNNFLIYPIFARMGLNPTPLRRMTVGMLMAAAAFAIVALLQERIDTAAAVGEKIAITWQVLPYLIMTQAEVMVSVTGLEFAYSQAPRRMKSTIMGFWLLTVAFGSKLVIVITKLPDMELSTFFWVFAALMAGASVLFGMRAAFYTYRDYAQEG